MDIRKISKPPVTDQSVEIQKTDSESESQQTEAQSTGFIQRDSLETIGSTNLATKLFETTTADNASQQESPTVLHPGSGGQTVLGKSTETPVSQSYAAKAENNLATSDHPDTYASIRAEIAGALGVSVSDPAVDSEYAALAVKSREQLEASKIAEHEMIINDALINGRRVEENLKSGDIDAKMFKEYVPGISGDINDFVLRMGTERTEHSIFGDTTTIDTNYFDSTGHKLGTVESVIEDGMETITKVIEDVAGAIGLKPGDTRQAPDPTSSSAGFKPRSWDPQPDGRYGTTSGSQSNNSQTSGSQDSGKESGVGAGALHDPDFQNFISAEAKESKSAPAPSGGTSSGGNPETRAGAVHVYHKEGSGKWEDKGTQWTENPPTEVTVEEPETDEGLAEEEEVEAGGDDNQAGWGDYADTGPAPPAQAGAEISESASGRRSYHAAESWPMFDENGKSLLQNTEGYADKPGGPIDYGNPTDPNAPSDFKDGATVKSHLGLDPTVTDPGRGEGGDDAATLDSSIRLDMAGTLRDGSNPLDPFATEAPAGSRPNTTDAERPGFDDDLP